MWRTWRARRHSYKCGARGAHVDAPYKFKEICYVMRTCQPNSTNTSQPWLFPGDSLICYTIENIPKHGH